MLEKQKFRRPAATQRVPGNKRVFRKRRRAGFYAFFALVVLALIGLGLASPFGNPLSDASGGPVQRVDTPAVADAPEAVADRAAEQKAEQERKEQEAAERQAAEERAAEREAAAPPPPEDPTMYLTVPRLGVYGHTIRNDDSEQALDLGAIKVPYTGFPWQEEDTNTYIAGHRIGWPNTESYYQFYDLPAMQQGDEVFLEDSNGKVYRYQVTEMFAVSPSETWVTEPIPGRDVVSLQTCTETVDDWWTIGPGLYGGGPESGRLVVRADRVG